MIERYLEKWSVIAVINRDRICRNQMFVLRNLGYDDDDIAQIGLLGVMNAARKYDRSHNTEFATYAHWHVRAQLSRHISSNSTLHRMPPGGSLLEGDRPLKTSANESAAFFDTIPHAGLRPEDRMMAAESNAEIVAAIKEVMRGLTPRERRAAEMRHGLDGGPCRTLDEIGAEIGVSKARVGQILARVYERMRASKRLYEVATGNSGCFASRTGSISDHRDSNAITGVA